MKRTFMAAAIMLSAALITSGVTGAAARTVNSSLPSKGSGGGAISCPGYSVYITWQSYYMSGYALSNDGWKTTNSAPILSFRWLGQLNQCFEDYQVSNGNWIETNAM